MKYLLNFLYFFRNKKKTEIKKILFVRLDNKIGDSIIDTFFVRELKKLFPAASITLLMLSPYDAIFEGNPYINKMITVPFARGKWRVALYKLLQIRAEHYDLVIDIPWPATAKRLAYLYFSGARQIMSANNKGFNFITYPLFWQPEKHIREVLADGLKLLGAKNVDCSYELFLQDQPQIAKLAADLKPDHKKLLVFNPDGASLKSTLRDENIKKILHVLKNSGLFTTVLSDYKQRHSSAAADADALFTSKGLAETAALIKHCDLVLSVDTGIVHLADVYKKPALVLYSSDSCSVENNRVLFSSVTPSSKFLQAETVNAIEPADMLNLLKDILNETN